MTAATVAPGRDARSPEPIRPIPMTRVVSVELRKMFDTRSGWWLTASIVVLSLLASLAVIAFGHDQDMKYSNFAAAIGIPIGILLPVTAVLAVTSEWSQRSGLTTFTLVPHRGRVILAKAYAAVLVGVASVIVALVIGAVMTLIGAAIRGVSPGWDTPFVDVIYIVVANVLSVLIGFMLGVLIRNSPAAIVAYFVYDFVIPTVFAILAANVHWFDKNGDWLDFRDAQSQLYNTSVPAQVWAKIAVSGLIWFVLPLAIGLRMVLRSEVK